MKATVLIQLLVASACVSRPPETDAQEPYRAVAVPVGLATSSVAASDVDGDGRLDLVVTGNGRVAVLLNAGSDRFELASELEVPNAVDLAIGDLDEDGLPDAVVANHETTHVTLLFGTGDGFESRADSRFEVGVSPHVHAVALVDVDGDGHLDLAVDDRDRESVRIFAGRGDGTFGEPRLVGVGGDPYRGFVLADVDGDDALDLVSPNPDHVAVVSLTDDGGPGAPRRLEPGLRPFTVSTGDFDGDGHLDIAAGSGEGAGSVAVWMGRADGALADPVRYDIARGPTRSASADLDGDGADELVVTSYLGEEVAVLVGGEEPALRRFPLAGYPYGVATGDFDGDGRPDFAVANEGADELTVFFTGSTGDRSR